MKIHLRSSGVRTDQVADTTAHSLPPTSGHILIEITLIILSTSKPEIKRAQTETNMPSK